MENSLSIMTKIQNSSRKAVAFLVLFTIFLAGIGLAWREYTSALQLQKLVATQSSRIVNNAIINQDLLSIQGELTRAGESIKDALGANLYAEIYLNHKLIAQIGLKKPESLTFTNQLEENKKLLDQSELSIRVFPDYRKAFLAWIVSVAFIFVLAIAISAILERFLKRAVTLWLNPLVNLIKQIHGIATETEKISMSRFYTSTDGSTKEIRDLTGALNQFLEAIAIAENDKNVAHQKLLIEERQSAKSRAIAEVSSMVAHDMRAPLGVFETILTVDKIHSNHKDAVRQALSRLHAMVESMRYTDRESLIFRQPCALEFDFLEKALESRLLEKNLKFNYPRSRSFAAFLDAHKIERALLNLLSNAVDAARAEVILTVESRERSLVLSVIDDGSGVPHEIIDGLFQSGVTRNKEHGTGLGLSFVKRIMQAHGGEVSYHRVNGFSIFKCVLPDCLNENSSVHIRDRNSPEIETHKFCVQRVFLDLEDKAFENQTRFNWHSFHFLDSCVVEAFEESDVVVTDREDTVLKALESDKEILEIPKGYSHDRMIARIRLKLAKS